MRINWYNVWSGGSVVLLVGIEIVLAAVIAAWSLSSLLEVGPVVTIILYLLGTALALAGIVTFVRMVHAVSPFFGRGEEVGSSWSAHAD